MSRIALVTDSSANTPPELVKQHSMHVIPLYVHFGEESYRDGVDMDTATFYEQLRSAPKLPTTSQPSVGDFMDLYRRLGQDADAIISIHISSGISGTVDSALAARQKLSAETENQPDVYVIDSRITASGLALLVTAAASAIATGLPADRVAQKVEGLAARLSIIFVVDTLEYLHKGGRIGGAAAIMGSVLRIKPILYLREGRIDVLEKVRTARKAKRRMLEIVTERANGRPIRAAIVHAQAAEEAERIRLYLADHFDCRELFIVPFSPVIATHVGPGTVGVSFYTGEGE
ncbi:MAG: DegV family protein [Chloroflexi bacterium]|nr:MAG: DegV family protein [Chloroflexota bacterium]RLC80363.1 MAG: DegV family protein [Chloroflexota bacterium]